MPDFYEEDKDIKLFKREYPDVYKFVLMQIEEKYDAEMVKNFIDEYGEDVYNDIKKIV